jgi:diguanylate cyclase (GGDEF)-like protein/PAS domain S-box-containing protein
VSSEASATALTDPPSVSGRTSLQRALEAESTPSPADADVLRRQNQALIILTRDGTLGDGDLASALRRATGAAAGALLCGRVRVWRRQDSSNAVCLHSFVTETGVHGNGDRITARFGAVFRVLKEDGRVAATDVKDDAAGREYRSVDPSGSRIGGLLIAPLTMGGDVGGFVAFEHFDGPRRWRTDEIGFARAISGLLALAIGAADRSHTALALRESEERFRLVAESMTDLVCLHDWQGNYLWLSPSCRRVLGYEAAELVGRDHFSLIHPDDEQRVRSNVWARMRRGEIVLPTTYRIRRKSGEYGWVETLAERVVKNGDVIRLQTSSREVTERIAAEQIIAQSEERYRTVVSNTIDGIVLADGTTLQILDANPAFEMLVGRPLGELTKLRLTDLLSEMSEEMLKAFASFVLGGAPYRGEQKYLRRDGTAVDVEVNAHTIQYRGGPVLCAVARDITDRKREEQLEKDRSLALELIATGEPLETTLAHLIELVERRCKGLRCSFGLEGSPQLEGFRNGDGAGSFSIRSQATPTGQSFSVPLVSAQGEVLGLFTALSSQDNSSAQDLGVFMMAARLAAIALDQETLSKRLAHQAHHDDLTGLPNRRRMQDRLALALAEARTNSRGIALLFLDLDRFKLVNDTLGHSAGDRLLSEAALRIGSVVRGHDTVARMGGDEFIVLACALNDPAKDALALSDRIMAELTRPFVIENREIIMTASVGVATYPEDGTDAESLIKHADTALYRAKDAGRNRVFAFTPDLQAEQTDRLEMERDLRSAIERNELVIHYQPQFAATTGHVMGMEALVRWQHPRRGMIAPSSFLPLAEEIGFITTIDHWVLRTASVQARNWQAPGRELRLAVNLSARHFKTGDIAEDVRAALAETGLAPHLLELELTETSAMENAERTLELLRRIKSTGVTIAIDDFGTGYSSLAYLKRFPLDALKIDRTFISDLGRSSDDGAIASAIVAMALTLGMRVVAEGVETKEQLDFLTDVGCQEVQGFHLSRPLPPEEFAATYCGGSRPA